MLQYQAMPCPNMQSQKRPLDFRYNTAKDTDDLKKEAAFPAFQTFDWYYKGTFNTIYVKYVYKIDVQKHIQCSGSVTFWYGSGDPYH
jgi:hypothetical protein